jgi:D-serine dehydratase
MANQKTAPAVPELVINQKKYKAVPPKARAWRDFIVFEENVDSIPAKDFMDRMAALIADVFPEEITADVILDNIPINEIKKLYRDSSRYVIGLVYGKLEQLPNGEAEAAE